MSSHNQPDSTDGGDELPQRNHRCVITLGISAPPPPNHPQMVRDFRPGIERLGASLTASGYDGAFLYWDSDYPNGSPTHQESPCGFKPFCFLEAAEAGYDLVLWLDATVEVTRSVDGLFRAIERDGYLFFAEDHSIGEYCKDEALGTLGLTREAALKMPCCWASAIGLDLRTPRAKEFLKQWSDLAVDGITFPGPRWSGIRGYPLLASPDPRVKGHRCDQTAGSVVALRLGMDQWKPKAYFQQFLRNERRWIPTWSPKGDVPTGPTRTTAGAGDLPAGGIRILFFSRGRGRGHAVPDLAIAEEISRFDRTISVQFVSYGTGAETIRRAGRSVIDLGLPEDNLFMPTLTAAHALIAALKPTLVVSHEEFSVLPAAQMAGVRSVLITDWFPPATNAAGEAVAFADSIIFLGEGGIFPLPGPVRRAPVYVGPVVKKMSCALADRNDLRRGMGIGEAALVVAVIPGAWANETRAPIAQTVLQAYRQLATSDKVLLWLCTAKDHESLSQLAAGLPNVRVIQDCAAVENVIVASDVVIAKGNRGTIMDAASLGVPSISLSGGMNRIDEILVARIRSNVALEVHAVDAAMLVTCIERQHASRGKDRPEPLNLHVRGGEEAARTLVREVQRLCARPGPVARGPAEAGWGPGTESQPAAELLK